MSRILSREGKNGVALQFRDVGGYPPHGTGTGGFPIPGGVETY